MKIGLIPMAAKPYHSGHHYMVETAASQNDKVILFASLSDRNRPDEFPISGMAMEEIWRNYVVPILPSNVELRYSRIPVREVYETLIEADSSSSSDAYTVYSDPVDTKKNYPEHSRQKYFPTLYNSNQVVFAAESDPAAFSRGGGSPDMSGTKARKCLAQGSKAEFRSCMPAGMDTDAVYDILQGNNQSLKEYVAEILKM